MSRSESVVSNSWFVILHTAARLKVSFAKVFAPLDLLYCVYFFLDFGEYTDGRTLGFAGGARFMKK
jgi:hypothetical protein